MIANYRFSYKAVASDGVHNVHIVMAPRDLIHAILYGIGGSMTLLDRERERLPEDIIRIDVTFWSVEYNRAIDLPNLSNLHIFSPI